LLDPAREEIAVKTLAEMATDQDAELAQKVVAEIVDGMRSEKGEVQALAFRHAARIPVESISDEVLGEVLALMKQTLHRGAAGSVLEAMTGMGSEWVRSGWKDEWAGVLEEFHHLAANPSPALAAQAARASEFVDQALSETNLKGLLDSLLAGRMAVESVARVLVLAGTEKALFVVEPVLALNPGEVAWTRGLDLLYRLQAEGFDLLETHFASREIGVRIAPLLMALEHIPLTAGFAPVFAAHWKGLEPHAKKKVMDLAAKWESGAFRTLLLDSLMDANLDVARYAAKMLPRIHIEGDAVRVVEAVEARPHADKDEKELFTLVICRALGEMADPMSITPLMEWSQSYGLLERRREKSLTVRMAAVEALGNFKSRQVEIYLERMAEKEDKDIKHVAIESLKHVRERRSTAKTELETQADDRGFPEVTPEKRLPPRGAQAPGGSGEADGLLE
jgi:hypothetical protein